MAGRLPAAVVALVVTSAVAGCTSLPRSGPVEAGAAPAPSASAAPFDFNPPGPVAGADRQDIVGGFLRALQASPNSTTVAEEFLTSTAADAWRPDQRTIVYAGHRVLTRRGQPEVDVRLEASFELDRKGRWVEPAGGTSPAADGTDRTLDFRFTREDGEWRIAALPDAMVIPETHFEARYREYYLPFFDPTASVLVPEPVYLPWGVQAPTMLVAGLLAGPSDGGRAVERTFFSPSTRLGVGVPVSDDGVAEVPLSRHVLDLSDDELELAMAQLAWTLQQVGEISRFQVTVEGSPIQLPGGQQVVDVDSWSQYAPWAAFASTDLFAVRDRTVVQLVDGEEVAVAELPRRLRRPRGLGVNLVGQQFALVTADGRRVVLVARTADAGSPPALAYRGTDVLRPMWDHTGRLWVLDRTASAPVVTVVHDGQPRRIAAPGLGGEPVLAASLSRDGTRMVVAVDGAERAGDRLMTMRVIRRASGAPVRLTRPEPLPTPGPLRRVLDVGWRDPTTVAVLARPSRTTTEVVPASIDGSSGPIGLDSALDVLFQPGVSMAALPGPTVALYVASRDGGVHALDAQGRWDLDAVSPGLRLPTFVG